MTAEHKIPIVAMAGIYKETCVYLLLLPFREYIEMGKECIKY